MPETKKVEETLSLDEIYEVALSASECGITKFKITGGEPLIRDGIVDFIGLNDDGSIDIIDYKTSTMYKGEKQILHSFQLILYAICLENMGFKINRISWNFLKYARKVRRFKNGNTRLTNVERRTLKYNNEFEDCIVEIDYNVENKKKALKFIFDNVKLMFNIDREKDKNTNLIPCNYNEFFCKNLCSFYNICNVSR